jgi:ankyrin repeat protein
MAIHFAVLKGNHRIIESLINDFKADFKQVTANGLSVLHCAAQYERGTLSLEMFSGRNMQIDVRDNFRCTPLHFAVLNMQIKCVEILIAKGADINAINSDNQTPLHIAILKYIQ